MGKAGRNETRRVAANFLSSASVAISATVCLHRTRGRESYGLSCIRAGSSRQHNHACDGAAASGRA